MRILVTRPREDGKEIAARLSERGHRPLLAPLVLLRFYQGPELDLSGVQALLATSANAIRAFVRRTPQRNLSVFAVGPQTAEEARNAGFSDVRNADGDANALAQAATLWAAKKGALLHICSDDAPGTLTESLTLHGFEVRRCPLYAIEPAARLPIQARQALENRDLDGVMFFSPKSARIFAILADGLPTKNLTAFCISQPTAQALNPMPFGHICVAAKPNQAAILALLD